jgi:hypothetical protein
VKQSEHLDRFRENFNEAFMMMSRMVDALVAVQDLLATLYVLTFLCPKGLRP